MTEQLRLIVTYWQPVCSCKLDGDYLQTLSLRVIAPWWVIAGSPSTSGHPEVESIICSALWTATCN